MVSHELVFKRKYADGTCVVASPAQGPDGFLMVSFPGEKAKQSDTPNLALLPIAKRPAAAASQVAVDNVKKRPAASLEVEKESSTSSEIEELPAAEAATASKPTAALSVFMKYSKPYKYPSGKYAIRRQMKHDKKQIVQIAGENMDEDSVYEVMLEASNLLNSGGLVEEELKQWLNARIS